MFHYYVSWVGTDAAIGGFSEVTGLDAATTAIDYREGADDAKHPEKSPRPRKSTSVILKRGLMASGQLSAWIQQAARRDFVVTLRDEKGAPVRRWILHGARPQKWTGPSLVAKGGGDVAMEELVLSSEGIELE
jgi:phage tail-like protein